MCESCNWKEVSDRIEDMVELLELGGWYRFADTLTEVNEWILEQGHVTEAQRAAIDWIESSGG